MSFVMDESVVASDSWILRTQQLLDSYEHWLGESLIPRVDPRKDSQRVAEAPFVLVAHGTEEDPLLNFANQAALTLWEMSIREFLGTPSRLTAEPVHRDERARLLQRTTQHGFISDYSGIRITSSGSRFEIHRAIVWNVIDSSGAPAGQAATFSDWNRLPDTAE